MIHLERIRSITIMQQNNLIQSESRIVLSMPPVENPLEIKANCCMFQRVRHCAATENARNAVFLEAPSGTPLIQGSL